MPETQIDQAVGAAEKNGRRSSFGILPIPQSRFVIWVNIALSLVIGTIGFGVGFGEGYLSAQQVILFGVVTAALLFLLLNYIAIIFEDRRMAKPRQRLNIDDCGFGYCGGTTSSWCWRCRHFLFFICC